MGTTSGSVVGSKTVPDPGVESIAKIVNSFMYLPVLRVVGVPLAAKYINVLHLGSVGVLGGAKV